MIRVHYPALFANDPVELDRVMKLSGRTYELADFLANVVKIKNIPGHYSGTLTYHDSCAGLRELGVQAQPRALLAKMPGITIAEMNESTTCCGFGGTFSVKFGDISTRMADRKCASITHTGAGAVVAGDLGCLLNIEGRLRRNGDTQTRVLHIAEVLAGDNGESPWK
jgi:L-lactate dehydrogenase complex protein LldE